MNKEELTAIRGAITPEIGKGAKLISMAVRRYLADHGIELTKEQYILMRFLTNGPKPQSSLAIITERDKGSLTRLVQSLERKGLLHRTGSKTDKRVNLVALTSSGEALVAKAAPIIFDLFKKLQTNVSEEDKAITIRTLKCMQNNATALLNADEKQSTQIFTDHLKDHS